jgi:polygalacturonase
MIRDLALAGAGLALASCISTRSSDPWSRVDDILARIVPPRFPQRDFLAANYTSIQQAIEACAAAGGGRVVVPAGDRETDPLRLRSRVNLHLEKGATLRFTRDTSRYPLVLTRFEGVELMNYSPLVYAFECEDVAVTGEGTLDGQADETHWWPWKGVTTGNRKDVTKNQEPPAPQIADRDALNAQAERVVPVAERVYGAGHFLRPAFIEPYRCKNVLIEGVTIINSPMWVMHPTLSNNVTVRRVTVKSEGPNNDGCDPESCRGVLIEDCVFETGDDCIALKSGRNADGRRVNVPVEDVVIRHCRMGAGHGGITAGSEVSGGVRNVFAERCTLDSPNLERGLRLKTNSARGGFIENVFARDIEIGNVKLAPIEIDLRYQPPESGPYTPVVRNVRVERMHSAHSSYGIYVRGLDDAPVTGVVIRDSVFRGVEKGNLIEGAVDIELHNLTVESKS